MTIKNTRIRRFRRIMRRFERVQSIQQKDNSCCCGATLAQCHALLELEELGDATLGELARSIGLDKSTLSRTVDGLVNLGLVRRRAHPSDRRCSLLSLTKQGRKTCDTLNRTNDQIYYEAFRSLSQEDYDNMIKYFELMVDALKAVPVGQGESGDLCD